MKQRHLSRRFILASGLATMASFAAPAVVRSSPAVRRIAGAAFGTRWSVALRPQANADALAETIRNILVRTDQLMSPWRRDSALAAFNETPGTDWVSADGEVVQVVRAALAIRRDSAGAFDPAVGPLVARWGFGPIRAKSPPDHASVMVSEDAVRKSHPHLTLDLCGIAKGYALDRMTGALLDRGERDFVIDFGGEVAGQGRHPAGRTWRVAVEDPRPGFAGSAAFIALNGRAIATSGDKINAYSLAGRRYSHIIDPATASPVSGATASVSVIASTATMADGWATALMAAGDNGPALAQRNGLDALFLLRDGGDLRQVAVGRFEDYLA